MPIDFFDIMENNDGYVVVFADSLYRCVDFVRQFAVENEKYLNIGIMLLQTVEHTCHGRAESVKFLVCPIAIFKISDRGVGPTIVGGTEDENNIGATEVFETIDKRAVGVVLAVITREAHRGARERVVLIQSPTLFCYQLVPPSLFHCCHVGVLVLSIPIPYSIGVSREIILECAI